MQTLSRKNLNLPVYQRIEEDLRHRIRSGAWSIGSVVPSRAALAREYGVGLATLERAVSALLAEGCLKAGAGQRTIVANGVHAANGERSNGFRSEDIPEKVLGVISIAPDDISGNIGHWLRDTVHQIGRAYLGEHGTTLFKILRDADGKHLRTLTEAISTLKDDGAMVFVICDLTRSLESNDGLRVLHDLGDDPLRLVHISDSENDFKLPHVYYDSAHLGRQAARYLIGRGFRDLAYVSPFEADWSRERFEQARAAACSEGLEAGTVRPFFGGMTFRVGIGQIEYQQEGALQFGRELFRGEDYPRCIIAANDYAAYGLIDAAAERGLSPGRDFAILGFDDEIRSLHYGLTTFRPPLEEIGKEAALLLKRLEQGEECTAQVRLRSRLIARASTARRAGF